MLPPNRKVCSGTNSEMAGVSVSWQRENAEFGGDDVLKPGITLYFVRHGETDWNRDQRYQGQKDIPLNATGRTQAARNGRTLAEALGKEAATIDYVSSPLVRARETMELIRVELGLPPRGYRTDDRLREIHYGRWEGELWNELPAKDPQGFAAREADRWGWRPTGGESYRDLSERVADWLGGVERNAVIAAHGGVMRVLRGLCLGLQPAEIFLLDVPQDKVLVVEAGRTSWL
jgi:probable phosphoglycerate mutase